MQVKGKHQKKIPQAKTTVLLYRRLLVAVIIGEYSKYCA